MLSSDAQALVLPRATRRAVVVTLLAGLAGCGSGGAPSTSPARTPPDLRGFLRLPVATPSSCAPSTPGAASGRRSPWVGHVDVSVFVAARASAQTTKELGATLRGLSGVRTVYAESTAQARAEFARLYTCSDRVPAAAVRASYRLVLDELTQGARDALVRRIRLLPGVGDVSCDPANPCLDLSHP